MPDKIVNHFVLADGSTARYDYEGLLNAPDFDSLFSKMELVTSYNVLEPSNIETGRFYNLLGYHNTSSAYNCTANIIPVAEGDIVRYYNNNTIAPVRYVTAYNANGEAVQASGAENLPQGTGSYTVPSGITGVRISWYSGNAAPMITINNDVDAYREYFAPYYQSTPDFLNKSVYMSTMPEYIKNALAYRPLGVLSKGYICLVSDDGNEELATYTIPMLINKEVPGTFAVMRSSHCWEDNTNKATVIDAVNNHGCNIAQHGHVVWTNYNEQELDNYFSEETAFFTSLGLTAYGAVCPAHMINNTIRVVAGGWFGSVRTGYQYAEQYYPGYTNGARSNIFGLTSLNIIDDTLAGHKTVLDRALANHELRMIHWHEAEMSTAERQKLEDVIDYAKQIGLTFITMKDIPTIV